MGDPACPNAHVTFTFPDVHSDHCWLCDLLAAVRQQERDSMAGEAVGAVQVGEYGTAYIYLVPPNSAYRVERTERSVAHLDISNGRVVGIEFMDWPDLTEKEA